MAIIYSYPLADEVTNDSWVLGSEMDNGLRVVKNYSVGDIVSFTRGFVTLNDVLDNDNESFLDAKIGDLYLYDDFNEGYGKIRLSNDAFMFTNFTSAPTFYVDSYSLSVGGKMIIDGQNLTQPRQFTMPNKSGVVALIEDIVTPDLQIVTDEGSVTTNPVEVGELRLGDTSTGNYSTIYALNDAIYLKNDQGDVFQEIEIGREGKYNLLGGFIDISHNLITGTKNRQEPNKSGTYAMTNDLPQIADNFANDAAAEIGGIDLGGLYHTNGTVKIRID
jgi:hypothetical protein